MASAQRGSEPAVTDGRGASTYKWTALTNTTFGTFMATVDAETADEAADDAVTVGGWH